MNFDAKKETKNVVEFIKKYYKDNHLGGAVIGVSGGKDSAVVLALLVKALGKENVIGLTLPCHSKNEDKSLAQLVANYYGVKLYNVDLTTTFDVFTSEIENSFGKVSQDKLIDSNINLKPRLRMSTLYYFAAMLSKVKNVPYLVVGTSNKCELYVGYFTKGGDSVHDISPIADFSVEEVIKIGEVLKVPNEVLYRTPSDGISNMSDEDKLGVTYKEISAYLNNEEISETSKKRIETLHKNNNHKFYIPTYRKDTK
jgi:NAD+ synthase